MSPEPVHPTEKVDVRPGWWIGTFDQEGSFLGPFESRDLAIDVRWYVEQVNAPDTFWVFEVKERTDGD